VTNIVMYVPFNRPLVLGCESDAIAQALAYGELAGGGRYTKRCEAWLSRHANTSSSLLTPSCTHALEMAALLVDIQPGDEVIMPSWTFVSTANAFVLRGATPVFVDVRLDTCNLDERLIEQAITPKTKGIVPVHYAGVSCEMDAIMAIAERYGLWVIEDAAQAMMATYKERPLGGIGHLGAYSFHATKNYTSGGEGGALLISRAELTDRASIIREKGTNREAFSRGAVDRYCWLDIGSSYLPSEVQSAALSAQLSQAEKVNRRRVMLWERYFQELEGVCFRHGIYLPAVPEGCQHNGHLFYLRCDNKAVRDTLLSQLLGLGIMAQTHYEPLHLSPGGRKFGRVSGDHPHTIKVSNGLLRLPLHYALAEAEQAYVIESLIELIKCF